MKKLLAAVALLLAAAHAAGAERMIEKQAW
jgi:hypothetical protein